MTPILDIEVECGEQKSRLFRGMVVLRGTVNYCTSCSLVRESHADETQKAHGEGRTRSLQISRLKSLTL